MMLFLSKPKPHRLEMQFDAAVGAVAGQVADETFVPAEKPEWGKTQFTKGAGADGLALLTAQQPPDI
jgi:hypothetical protein